MVPLCRHVLSSNKTCGSPALRGQHFCYHHSSRRLSGPRRPATRSSYRWYAFYRKISTMRPERAIAVWNQVAEAVLNHEISPEWVIRIMNRYTARNSETRCAGARHDPPYLIENRTGTRKVPQIKQLHQNASL